MKAVIFFRMFPVRIFPDTTAQSEWAQTVHRSMEALGCRPDSVCELVRGQGHMVAQILGDAPHVAIIDERERTVALLGLDLWSPKQDRMTLDNISGDMIRQLDLARADARSKSEKLDKVGRLLIGAAIGILVAEPGFQQVISRRDTGWDMSSFLRLLAGWDTALAGLDLKHSNTAESVFVSKIRPRGAVAVSKKGPTRSPGETAPTPEEEFA